MTIRELASIAGVSPATVSLVLNDKKGVGNETRRHVQELLKKYDYSPSPPQKKQQRRRVLFIKYRTHGMAVEENQGFIASIIDQIESECRRFFFDLIMCNCNAETVEGIFRGIATDAPDGVIFLGTEFDAEYFHMLDLVNVPLVVLDNSMQSENVDSLVMANANIAATAVMHLYELGHRKIGYFKSNIHISNLKERYSGYLDILGKLNLDPPGPVYLTPTLNGAYSDMKALLKTGAYVPGGGVLADNDSVAIGASKALLEAGYRIPEDISIIGVDDIPYSAMMMPALTTMRISRGSLGVLAVDIIRKRIEYPSWPAMQFQITGQLIIRNSTGQSKIT